ncbi:protein serine/threonine phosphatase 2C [Dendrothele bispora CBS 962.96]|uniref:Protein serine/threonine phosphatase 2C n=1 Tax=Dendrothele bispora (strain CBS 962.96) TaxID=1314807 RepID=A0A4S8MUE2_DENBC|nr:protein serine/threonine phosphatase 2C [Dendrothele bispora CBS 962.96]
MFARFPRLAYRLSRLKPRTASALAVGTSTSLAILASLAAEGRTIRCDDSLQLRSERDEEEAREAFPGAFHKPRWTHQDYLSADSIFSGGPVWYAGKGLGLARCDALSVSANPESEDCIGIFFGSAEGDDSRSYIGLYDGHNGPATSDFLCDHLIPFLQQTLATFPHQCDYSGYLEMSPDLSDTDSDPVNDMIKQVFKEVDDSLTDVSEVLSSDSRMNAVRTLRYAYSGSCALVSVFEPDTRILRVALTGDSRAVLGRKIKNKKTSDGRDMYEVHVLSYDQNAYNKDEEARMNAEHPGEKIMDNGRVMGWGISRSFGNGAYKWSLDVQRQLHEKFLGDRPRSNVKTPPYFTAEPVITTTMVQPGDFLIMASDGLWDILTNEEVVGLVGLWLANNHIAVWPNDVDNFGKKIFEDKRTYERKALPVELKADHTTMYKYWHAEKRFVNKDPSVAAHLIRNAFGGADEDLSEALLSLSPPRSRRYRDDVSVIVSFFE